MLVNILSDIKVFFDEKCLVVTELSSNDTEGAVGESGNRDSLLRIACLGNAERTIQGELFAYLKSKGYKAILECSYLKNFSIDIAILGNNGNPEVFVELKHFSANQGTIGPLLKSTRDDMEKLKWEANVIAIGIYTSVESFVPKRPVCNKSYRFLYKYGVNNMDLSEKRFNDAIKKKLIQNVKYQSFCLSQSGGVSTVSGRVGYFMDWPGLNNGNIPESEMLCA